MRSFDSFDSQRLVPGLVALILSLLVLPTVGLGDFDDNVYTDGHGDIGVALEEENGEVELFLHYHFEGATINGAPVGDIEVDPADATVVVPESVRFELGSGGFPLLDLDEGDMLSVLPQNNPFDQVVPFLGIATEELANEWNSLITFEMTGFEGPGDFAMYQFNQIGVLDNVLVNTIDGGDGGDNAFDFTVGIHDHANYGFTETGIYDIEFTVSGTHSVHGFLSDTATFRFEVQPFASAIPEPSSILLIGLGGVGVVCSAAVARRRNSAARKNAA